ncbi:type VII secretion protein EccB, partial [Streptomyces sp. NPDC004011]
TVLVPLDRLAPLAEPDITAEPLEPACVPTDATVVRPGSGALVRALHASGAAHAGTTYLVAENGVKYRVSDKSSLAALGYGPSDIGSVPAPLLAALPTGADLDPAVASGAGRPEVTAPACGAAAGDGTEQRKANSIKTDNRGKADSTGTAPRSGTTG